MAINLNALTSALTIGRTEYYHGDVKLDTIELLGSMSEVRGEVEMLKEALTIEYDDEAEGNEDKAKAVEEFIANIKTIAERFTD